MKKKTLSTENSNYKKEIRKFIRGGGKVNLLPDEIEWNMFPLFDEYQWVKNEKEKGILDYEESQKPRGKTLDNE